MCRIIDFSTLHSLWSSSSSSSTVCWNYIEASSKYLQNVNYEFFFQQEKITTIIIIVMSNKNNRIEFRAFLMLFIIYKLLQTNCSTRYFIGVLNKMWNSWINVDKCKEGVIDLLI